jgi:hypothetical protein
MFGKVVKVRVTAGNGELQPALEGVAEMMKARLVLPSLERTA